MKFLISIFLIFYSFNLSSQVLKQIKEIYFEETSGSSLVNSAYNFLTIQNTLDAQGNKFTGYFKKNGDPLLGFTYPGGFDERQHPNRARVSIKEGEKEKYGFADTNGKIIIDCVYSYLSPNFWDGKTIGRKGNDWVIVDTIGNETILPPAKYSQPEVVGENRLKYRNHTGRYAIGDFQGNSFTRGHNYLTFDPYYPNYYLAGDGQGFRKSLYANGDSTLIFAGSNKWIMFLPNRIYYKEMKLSFIKVFKPDMAPIESDLTLTDICGNGYIFKKKYRNGDAYGITDSAFNIIVPSVYNWIDIPHNAPSFIKVKLPSGKYGLLNAEGKEVLPVEFDHGMEFFTSHDIIVKKSGLHFWYDKDGEQLSKTGFTALAEKAYLQSLYNDTSSAYPSLAVKDENGKFTIITRKGKIIKMPYVKDMFILYQDAFIFQAENSSFGIMNGEGKITLEAKYQKLFPIYSGIANPHKFVGLMKIFEDGKVGVAHVGGKVLINPTLEVPTMELVSEKYLWIKSKNSWKVYEYNEKNN